jgi:hypothetical protein
MSIKQKAEGGKRMLFILTPAFCLDNPRRRGAWLAPHGARDRVSLCVKRYSPFFFLNLECLQSCAAKASVKFGFGSPKQNFQTGVLTC